MSVQKDILRLDVSVRKSFALKDACHSLTIVIFSILLVENLLFLNCELQITPMLTQLCPVPGHHLCIFQFFLSFLDVAAKELCLHLLDIFLSSALLLGYCINFRCQSNV